MTSRDHKGQTRESWPPIRLDPSITVTDDYYYGMITIAGYMILKQLRYNDLETEVSSTNFLFLQEHLSSLHQLLRNISDSFRCLYDGIIGFNKDDQVTHRR